MGRSQVLRNRTRGRPGQGRGGRGGGSREGGAGRGGSSTNNTSRRHKGGIDPSKLGDNSFRYERNNINNVASDDNGGGGGRHYDGLLDDINFMSSGVGGVGEYYGDSHYAPNDNGEEDLVDAILLSSATAALSLSSEKSNEKRDVNHHNQQQNKDTTVAENWMTIDIKALDKCMKQIPIHERLKLPRHVGRHLEDMYGVGPPSSSGGGGRKQTLAQLREESKCIASKKEEEEESKIESSSNEELQSSESGALPQNDSEKVEDKIPDNRDADNNANDDEEEEEDLDAWLDDMIA